MDPGAPSRQDVFLGDDMTDASTTDLVATTAAGRLRGTDRNGIKAFLGVPYAAPPTGANRFRPPQPVEPWTGVRDALELGPSCPQPRRRPPGWAFEPRESEDCLYLNVWTPALDTAKRPVMVWYHGGGYSIGSGSWPLYDGTALARRGDVVVVTVNHRLGPLGYLHLADVAGDEFASSGNNGMLDLVATLEWVRDNIAGFGGDPGNVTIFGESGGGAKVSTLLAMPAARGLFHRAIIQSGPGLRVTRPDRAAAAASKLLEALSIAPDRITELWDVPAEKLVEASAAAGRMGFAPVLDGTVIPEHPQKALAAGTAADVPVIVGCNRDESAGALPRELDADGLRERVAALAPDHVDRVLETYRAEYPDASEIDLLSWALTDTRMRAGSIRLAEAKLAGTVAPVWMYFFTYALNGRAGHGYEISFAFDNLGRGDQPASPSRQKLAEEMSEAWIAFARDGDPNHAGLEKWSPYTLPERSTMYFQRDGSQVRNDPNPATRELWDDVVAATQAGRRR